MHDISAIITPLFSTLSLQVSRLLFLLRHPSSITQLVRPAQLLRLLYRNQRLWLQELHPWVCFDTCRYVLSNCYFVSEGRGLMFALAFVLCTPPPLFRMLCDDRRRFRYFPPRTLNSQPRRQSAGALPYDPAFVRLSRRVIRSS